MKLIWKISVMTWCMLLTINAAGQVADYPGQVRKYIETFKDIAVNEMVLFRIPASITLAQGIIESAAGTSKLATQANNHFGIKCHREWNGKTFYQDDDEKNECFRKYGDPVESYRDHSQFLTSRDRYKGLFALELTDYKAWANGLKAAGYATNPKYPELLIRTIENYTLFQFDRMPAVSGIREDGPAPEMVIGDEVKLGFAPKGKGPGDREIFMNNRRKLIIARSDDNIYFISKDFNIPVDKLLQYNDLPFATSLKPGQIVYLQHKRRKAEVRFHTFHEGESLYGISQRYGIKLKMIWKRNGMEDLLEPRPGTVLKLR